ncbi:MAG: DUF167 domain-containing protein [Candidatus Paceibacterota bacterium]|jgi:uncharacterized protein YggU (UPF0235/DUF167 family)
MTYLKTFITPSAKREEIKTLSAKGKEGGETLAISVREPATGNRANLRVREIIAERFGKPVGKVRILTGHHARSKMISITDD